MADNTTLNSGSGGDTIRALEDTDSIKWPVGVTAFATTVGTPDVPAIVTPTTGLPVRLADGSGYLSTLPVSLASVPSHAVTGPLTDTELRASAVPVSGTFYQATQPVSIAATVTVAGTVDLGATDNAVLDAIAASAASTDTKTPALGQALAAGSVPVVLTAAQLTTLTPPAAITGFATESTLSTLNGKVTAVNTGAVTISTALPAGANAIGKLAANDGVDIGDVTINNASLAVTGTFWQATQPVSIASAVPITDNSGSLTVDAPVGTPVFVRLSDGSSAISTLPVSLASVPTHAVTQSGTWTVTGTGGTFPVTDSGGSLTVDDGGSSLTVDGTVAATQSGTWSTRLQDGSGNAITSATRGGEQALSVQIVDGSGSQIASFGGGTQYTEGDTDASITGTAMLWEDTGDTLRAVSAAKPLPIGDAGGSITVDGTVAFSNTTIAVTNAGTFAVQAAQSGTWNVGTVTAVTTITNPVTAVGAAAHDAVVSGNPVLMGGYASAAAPSVVATGDAVRAWHHTSGAAVIAGYDYSGTSSLPLSVNGSGQLIVAPGTTFTVNGTVAATQSGGWLVGGDTAHDATDAGSPVKVGARAAATLSDDTMVANGDRTDNVSDLDGTVIVRPHFPLGDLISEAVSDTGGSSTAFTNFGAVASTRNYVTAIHVFRTDAGTSVAYVDFRDGTGGSVLYRAAIPPNGGAVITLGGTPLFRTSANTALAYDVSAALTTVYITVSGFRSKV